MKDGAEAVHAARAGEGGDGRVGLVEGVGEGLQGREEVGNLVDGAALGFIAGVVAVGALTRHVEGECRPGHHGCVGRGGREEVVGGGGSAGNGAGDGAVNLAGVEVGLGADRAGKRGA